MRTLGNKPMAVAALMLFIASPAFAQGGPGSPSIDKFDLGFDLGPIAAAVHMTKPVQGPNGLFKGTLHLQARDDTQTPAFHASLEAVGEAADPETLLGGLLPAAIRVEEDLVAGMTFTEAAADAQAKTGVTLVSFHDPTAVEYAVMLALIIVVCITAITAKVSTPARDQLLEIRAQLEASLAAIGISPPGSIVP